MYRSIKDYEMQKQAWRLKEENITLAKENVMIALERFKLGVSTYLELRETQKTLEDAYNRLLAARYNTKLAETELLKTEGRPGWNHLAAAQTVKHIGIRNIEKIIAFLR